MSFCPEKDRPVDNRGSLLRNHRAGRAAGDGARYASQEPFGKNNRGNRKKFKVGRHTLPNRGVSASASTGKRR